MSIELFVAAEGWDIAQVVSVTRAGSNVVYSALISWVFLAAFGMLISEAYKVFQGSTASITGALLRIAIAVGLLTNFHTWTGEIGNAINGTVQTIGNGGGQDQLMADYAAILQDPGKNDHSSNVPFWDFIAKAGASGGDQMIRVTLWVLGAGWYAVFWPILISKALVSGGTHAGNWILESISPVMSAGQGAVNVATTAATGGGGGAAVQAGGLSLASRPTKSPKA